MDASYRAIYDEIYRERTAQGRLFEPYARTWDVSTADVLRYAIESAERQEAPYRRLREDAKALLVVNFQEMVLAPLSRGGQVAPDEVADDVQSDIAMLVNNARTSEPGPDGTEEISGHGVVDSLSQNWRRLRISRFRLWERS
jgi:hypothetical protein